MDSSVAADQPRSQSTSSIATAWERANHWDAKEDAGDHPDDELDDQEDFAPSPARRAELEAMSAESRGPSLLTYEFVTQAGERLSFEEALCHREFLPQWSDD